MNRADNSTKVGTGTCLVAKNTSIHSEGFFNCNLLLLRNSKSNEVFFCHSNSDDATDAPRFAHYPIGFTDTQAETLEKFLAAAKKQKADVTGMLLYNHHDDPSITEGYQHGAAIIQLLRDKGVRVVHRKVPSFTPATGSDGYSTNAAFNAYYDAATETLTLTQSSVVGTFDKDIKIQLALEDNDGKLLDTLKPFDLEHFRHLPPARVR